MFCGLFCVRAAGRDRGSEVGINTRWVDEGRGKAGAGVYVEKGTNELLQGFVEIHEESGRFVIEGQEVICIVFEERGVAIGTSDCVPVVVTPCAVVADAKFAYLCM